MTLAKSSNEMSPCAPPFDLFLRRDPRLGLFGVFGLFLGVREARSFSRESLKNQLYAVLCMRKEEGFVRHWSRAFDLSKAPQPSRQRFNDSVQLFTYRGRFGRSIREGGLWLAFMVVSYGAFVPEVRGPPCWGINSGWKRIIEDWPHKLCGLVEDGGVRPIFNVMLWDALIRYEYHTVCSMVRSSCHARSSMTDQCQRTYGATFFENNIIFQVARLCVLSRSSTNSK